MAYLRSHMAKQRQNLCRQSQTFNDEQQILFVFESCYWLYKDEYDDLIFCFFCMSIAPPNHPPTLKICDPSLTGVIMAFYYVYTVH